MQFCNKVFSVVRTLLIMITGLLVLSGTSFAAVQGTGDGLWHTTSIDGYDDVWYYGQDSSGDYNTGSSNSGTLTMDFDLSGMNSPYLTLETKWEAETSTYYDEMTIMIGSDVVWTRDTNQSEDEDGNWGWETLALDLSSYYDTSITVTFSFDTKDSVSNSYFGWAVYNVQAVDYDPANCTIVINQLDVGNLPAIGAFVTVADDTGANISGLAAVDFSLLEDGSIVSSLSVSEISAAGDVPALSLGLMIDQGSSMGTDLSDAVTAVKEFIDLATDARDQFGLVAIGSTDASAVNQVLALSDFTTDKTELQAALNTLAPGDKSPLYDGIAKALELTAQQAGFKAVVALSAGADDSSTSYTADTVADYAKTLGIPVYTIGMGSADADTLTQIAEQTGGTYSAASAATDLATIYSGLMAFMDQQYYISFTSLGTGDDEACITLSTTVDASTGVTQTVSDIDCYDTTVSAPDIALDSTTTGYLTSGAAYGADLTIGAEVTDADGDTVSGVTLYYRQSGSTDSFTTLAMDPDGSVADTYIATIDGASFSDPGIEFFITASDGTLTGSDPTGGTYTIVDSGSSTGTGNTQEISILSPANNETLTYGNTGGSVTFSWTDLSSVEKYVLNLDLTDILSDATISLTVDINWCANGSASCTPDANLAEGLFGMTYTLTLDTDTWNMLALYDVKWGVEAYDEAGNLIGSTFEDDAAAAAVYSIKFLDSSSIVLLSPAPGEVLNNSKGSAPTFKWESYTGADTYTVILAHTGTSGIDNVLALDAATLNFLSMDQTTWESMDTGTWHWTVLGHDSSGNQTPTDFTIFDFEIQQSGGDPSQQQGGNPNQQQPGGNPSQP